MLGLRSGKSPRLAVLGILAVALLGTTLAQQASQHLLAGEELKKIVPAEFFFRGQKTTSQLRNSTGLQLSNGSFVIAALIDNGGYSSAIQQKYQGLLITEVKLSIGGAALGPGQYGFGFTADNKFVVMDVSSNDVLSTAYQTDQSLARPVPLKMMEVNDGYRLYGGRKWVEVKVP